MMCEYLPTCVFLERVSRMEPYTATMIRLTYCDTDKCGCARYKVSRLLNVAETDVPDELWPSDDMKSLEIPDDDGGKGLLP